MISDVYRTLWRQRWFMLFVTGVVVAAAFFLTTRQTKQYTATSLVRVQQDVRNAEEAFGALLTGERLARTYERIAETDSVRELVQQEVPRSVPEDAVSVEAAQVSNLELLGLSVTYSDPKVAATVANAVPRALATFIDKTGSFRDTITVVERASVPSAPSSPNLRLNLMLAFMLAVVLSVGLALLRESLSDRVEDIEDLEKVAGHPVIAVIPNLRFQPARALRSRPNRPAAEIASSTTTEAPARWSVRG